MLKSTAIPIVVEYSFTPMMQTPSFCLMKLIRPTIKTIPVPILQIPRVPMSIRK